MGARQTAAFWIEHVSKFGGEHLRPTSMKLTWWQLYCLDTLGFIGIVLLFISFVIFTLIRFILKTLIKWFGRCDHTKKD